MKWAIAAGAVVVLANGLVLAPAWRERSGPVSRATIDVCASQVRGGRQADEPPAIWLNVAPDSLSLPAGLDSAGLRALGFSETAVAGVGKERDSTFRWRQGLPAWVRIRRTGDLIGSFSVVEVAARRERLTPDSTSFAIRGMVALRERWDAARPAAGPEAGKVPHLGNRGVVYPTVSRLLTRELHLDRRQIGALRAVLGDSSSCAARAVIATGASGRIWVDAVR